MKRPGYGRAVVIIRKRSGCGLGLRFGFLLRLGFGLVRWLVVGLLVLGLFFRRLRRLVLEVGGVPAATFQLEARGAEELAERRLVADGTLSKWRLTDTL